MFKKTAYNFCKNNYWKAQADKETGKGLAKKGIQIIEIADYSEESFNQAAIKVLLANRHRKPFVIINPDSTSEQKVFIKKTCQAIKPVNDACVVFFTSGSTGKPKPVQWTNKMIVHHAKEKIRYFNLKKTDRFAHVYSLNSLGGLSDFFMCCLSGADFIYLHRERGEEGIVDQILDKKINVFNATPFYWKKIIEILKKRKNKLNLTAYIVGGNLYEQLIIDLSKRVKTILTAYGATEAFGAIGKDMYKKGKPTCVGRAVGGSKIIVVDSKGKECRPFEPGEIIISGQLVSPSCKKPYFSGDIGYKDEEGDLFISGRKEDQIKVNGIKVSLSQYLNVYNKYKAGVFSVLNPKTQWQEVVLVFETKESLKKVKKYVNSIDPPVSSFCRPRWVFNIKKLPTTTTGLAGKIDVPRLKELFTSKIKKTAANFNKRKNIQSPETRLEKEILKIWQKVLGVKKIGLDDKIFDLGGNSFKITQINYLINKQLGLKIPIAKMFQFITINDFVNNYLNRTKREAETKEFREAKKNIKKLFLRRPK